MRARGRPNGERIRLGGCAERRRLPGRASGSFCSFVIDRFPLWVWCYLPLLGLIFTRVSFPSSHFTFFTRHIPFRLPVHAVFAVGARLEGRFAVIGGPGGTPAKKVGEIVSMGCPEAARAFCGNKCRADVIAAWPRGQVWLVSAKRVVPTPTQPAAAHQQRHGAEALEKHTITANGSA